MSAILLKGDYFYRNITQSICCWGLGMINITPGRAAHVARMGHGFETLHTFYMDQFILHRAWSVSRPGPDDPRLCRRVARFRPAPSTSRRNTNTLPCCVRAVTDECLVREHARSEAHLAKTILCAWLCNHGRRKINWTCPKVSRALWHDPSKIHGYKVQNIHMDFNWKCIKWNRWVKYYNHLLLCN